MHPPQQELTRISRGQQQIRAGAHQRETMARTAVPFSISWAWDRPPHPQHVSKMYSRSLVGERRGAGGVANGTYEGCFQITRPPRSYDTSGKDMPSHVRQRQLFVWAKCVSLCTHHLYGRGMSEVSNCLFGTLKIHRSTHPGMYLVYPWWQSEPHPAREHTRLTNRSTKDNHHPSSGIHTTTVTAIYSFLSVRYFPA